jgi:transcriptional regulator with XRE-family HTH domain
MGRDYSKKETDEGPNPTVDTLEKIAKALGVNVDELLK